MTDSIWKQGRFLVYFFLLYIANLASMAASVSTFLLSVSLSYFRADSFFVSFVIGLPRYTVIILNLIIFKFTERINKQKLMFWGSFSGIIAFLGLSFSSGYVSLMGFTLLYGFAYMVALNYITVMLLDYTPLRERATVLGIFTTSSSLGYFFGPFLTRGILDWVLQKGGEHVPSTLTLFGMFSPNWRYSPNLMFLAGVFYYAIVGIFMIMAERVSSRLTIISVPSAKEVKKEPAERKGSILRQLLEDYSGLTRIAMLLGSMWTALFTFVPSYDHHIGLGASSWFFFGFSILGLFGRLFLVPQLGRWGVGSVMGYTFSAYVTCFFLMWVFGLYPSWWILLLVGSVQGLAHGIIFPSMNVLFTYRVPNKVAHSTVAFIVMYFIGALINIPIGGIVGIIGHSAMFLGATIVFGLLVFFTLKQRSLQLFFHQVDATMTGESGSA